MELGILAQFLSHVRAGLQTPIIHSIMKSILPLCLIAFSLPLVLTGCNRGSDMGSTSSTDTNTPTASTDTNTATASTDTNAAPAPTDTNAAPSAPATNSGM